MQSCPMKFYLLVLVLWAKVTLLYAQKGPELGGWVGLSHYFGDLNTQFDLGLPGLAGGLTYRYNFNERVALRLNGNIGKLRGDDARAENVFQRQRNLSFRSLVFDGNLDLEFNFFPYIHGSNESYFTPYMFGGLSGIKFNPQANYEGVWYALQPLGTEGQLPGDEYSTFQAGLNIGFGFKFDLNYRWSINIEASVRKLFTDYIDDISTTYPNMLELSSQRDPMAVLLSDRSTTSPKLGLPGYQRGSSSDRDFYTFSGIALVYYFGKVNCPVPTR